MASFDEVLKDCTKLGTKIPTSEYLESGKYPIIDQGQNDIAGYYDSDDGLFEDVPTIVFGDHTRVVKYVDKPCFLGADGVMEMSRNVQSGNTQNLKSSAAPVRLPAAPASTPGTSQAAAQAGCVYRP